MIKHADRGFSLIELLIVILIIGIIAAIAIPQFLNAWDRAKQRRTMGDMRSMVSANATFFVDNQGYAPNLVQLQTDGYIQVAVTDDAWGNALVYNPGGRNYDLTSLGSDGAAGPPPPATWVNQPFDPDIIVVDGMFTQHPRAAQ